VRLNWEQARGAQLVRLAQAAWLTRESRWAEGAVAHGLDFAAANPPGLGVAWEHAQEVALRAVAWLWAARLLSACDAFDARARRAWLWALLAHGEYAASHLADHPVTHNHLVSEAAGLAVLGLALPGLAPAARWRRLGLRVLWREACKQVDDEGVHGEHSTHYHGFVLDSLLAALLACERAGAAVPPAARARVAGMADALAAWLREDGTLPAIGDTDAGRAWRLGGDPLDRRDTLGAAAIAFGRRDWGAIAGDAPGAFWIGGGHPVPGAGERKPPGFARRFDAAGLAVARTGYEQDAEIVVFRCGPTRFRPDVLRSHMHADALSVLWRVGGDDVLLDPGTYLYSEGEGWRAALRGTRAHACVVVDGRDQADVASQRFGIAGERCARWLAFEGGADRLAAAAEHPAGGAVRVRRRLAWRAGDLLALCDDVAGAGAHAVEAWLPLPPSSGAPDGPPDAHGLALTLDGGRRVLLQCFGDVRGVDVVRPDADGAPGPGWIAPRYGVRTPATAVRVDAGAGPLPRRLVTVLQTRRDGVSPQPVRCAADAGGVRIATERSAVRFDAAGGVAIEDAP
jgi:hypothetical protein